LDRCPRGFGQVSKWGAGVFYCNFLKCVGLWVGRGTFSEAAKSFCKFIILPGVEGERAGRDAVGRGWLGVGMSALRVGFEGGGARGGYRENGGEGGKVPGKFGEF
jgi:hypothetical protein